MEYGSSLLLPGRGQPRHDRRQVETPDPVAPARPHAPLRRSAPSDPERHREDARREAAGARIGRAGASRSVPPGPAEGGVFAHTVRARAGRHTRGTVPLGQTARAAQSHPDRAAGRAEAPAASGSAARAAEPLVSRGLPQTGPARYLHFTSYFTLTDSTVCGRIIRSMTQPVSDLRKSTS